LEPHLLQVPPPQSIAVSRPFFTPSEQVGVAQWNCVSQMPDVQSEPARHARLGTHAGQTPPQSTSVSLPSLVPLLQLGRPQKPLEQAPLAQSAARLQCLPTAQRVHVVTPPQSVSDSPPFWTLSEQDGGSQTFRPPSVAAQEML
jgi:hypothetical protein